MRSPGVPATGASIAFQPAASGFHDKTVSFPGSLHGSGGGSVRTSVGHSAGASPGGIDGTEGAGGGPEGRRRLCASAGTHNDSVRSAARAAFPTPQE